MNNIEASDILRGVPIHENPEVDPCTFRVVIKGNVILRFEVAEWTEEIAELLIDSIERAAMDSSHNPAPNWRLERHYV